MQARPVASAQGARVRTDVFVFIAGVALLIGVLGLDIAVFDRGLAEEGPPIWSGGHLIRMVVLALGSALLVVGARNLATRGLARAEPHENASEQWLAAATGSVVALASIALLLVDPELLSQLVREDEIVEWASAALAFAAAAAFGVAARRLRGEATAPALAALVMAGGCLLLGLEEISWFQRVLDIESPELMVNRNGQKETNLHNFATGATGNLYYVAACVYLVLIPAALGDRRLPSRHRWLRAVIPSRLVLYGSATAAGFVYAMWNIVWIQATFWVTLTALIVAARDRRDRNMAIGLAVVTALTAAVFLLAGDSMIRDWDDTEIRELVIP
ncbi:MAG: hypothetical protein OEW83_22110, partial [Acidimicrobiia bacterium]|nr:hypothetical protein [Acidimicrobiia bacterium]